MRGVDLFNRIAGRRVLLAERPEVLGTYYIEKAKDGLIGRPEEVVIDDMLEHHETGPDGILLAEICAGLAQASIFLSLLGYRTVALEAGRERAAAGRRLGQYLTAETNVIHTKWQDYPYILNANVIFTINAVSSNVDAERDAEIFDKLIEDGKTVILAPGLYGEVDKPIQLKAPGRYIGCGISVYGGV